MPKPAVTISLLVGVVILILALLTDCGGPTGLAQYVAHDCTTTPEQIVSARRSLRNTGMSKCADEATCDDAFVLAELARATDCPGVSLNGKIDTVSIVSVGPTTVHLFFEASISMYPYLAQETGLKNHLRAVVRKLQSPLNPAADNRKYYYVGYRSASIYDGESEQNFIETLTEEQLGDELSDVGKYSSDIADLVDSAFTKTGPADAAILVSDFVFSPPGNGNDDTQWFGKQQNAIIDLVEQRLALRNSDFSVVLIAADSDFDGLYYSPKEKGQKVKSKEFKGKRPYYYLVAGPRQLALGATERIESTIGKEMVFFSPETLKVPVSVVAPMSPSEGSFRESTDTDVPTITDAKPAFRVGACEGALIVRLKADLSGLADAARAVEPATVSGGDFELVEVVPITPAQPPYTHYVTLRRRGTQFPGTIIVEVPRSDASNMRNRYFQADLGDPYDFPGKTFGLQQLVEGIEGAYARYASTPAATLTFRIE